VTVATGGVFSATLAVALLVIGGASLTFVTVTAIACVALRSTVGDLHLHVVDVVAFRVAGRLEVRRREKLRAPVLAVDREARRVGAADDRVGERRCRIRVAGGDRHDGGVFSATLARRRW
jgi:hypothetical protein